MESIFVEAWGQQVRLQAQKCEAHPRVCGVVADPRRFMAALECLSYGDYSMAIKAGNTLLKMAVEVLWSAVLECF